MNVVFRVDASAQIGSGHVMRCLTLAHQLKEKGIHSTFVSRDLPGNMNAYIAKQFPVVELPTIADEDAWQWTAQHWQQDAKETIASLEGKAKLVIVDHYSIDEKWQQMLRPYTEKIMVIDDLANRKHDCDILLDQNYYLDMDTRYISLIPNHCKKLLGPNYALLREEFFDIMKSPKKENKITRIFVFFGGSDPTNDTTRTMNILIELSREFLFEVDIVVGASNINKKSIEKLCQEENYFYYYEQVSNIAEMMYKADFSIGAAGTTVWERGFIELPSVVVSLAENQIESSMALSQKEVIIYAGHYDEINVKDYYSIIKSLLLSPNKRDVLIKNFKSIMNPQFVQKKGMCAEILNQI